MHASALTMHRVTKSQNNNNRIIQKQHAEDKLGEIICTCEEEATLWSKAMQILVYLQMTSYIKLLLFMACLLLSSQDLKTLNTT